MQDDPDLRPEPARRQEDAVPPGKELSPGARRALAEAAERRAAIDARTSKASPEEGGRGGLEPVRYDDWEIGGRAVDF